MGYYKKQTLQSMCFLLDYMKDGNIYSMKEMHKYFLENNPDDDLYQDYFNRLIQFKLIKKISSDTCRITDDGINFIDVIEYIFKKEMSDNSEQISINAYLSILDTMQDVKLSILPKYKKMKVPQQLLNTTEHIYSSYINLEEEIREEIVPPNFNMDEKEFNFYKRLDDMHKKIKQIITEWRKSLILENKPKRR